MDKSKCHLIVSASLSVLILTGCVSSSATTSIEPGRYSNYRSLLVALGGYTKFPEGTPSSVKERYSQCSADFVLSGVSPIDLPKLDAYAQGRQDLPMGELNRINADIEAKLGRPLTEGGLERLEPFCPQDVRSFLQYPPHA